MITPTTKAVDTFIAASSESIVIPVSKLQQERRQPFAVCNPPTHTYPASKSLGVRISASGISSSLYTSTSSFGTYCKDYYKRSYCTFDNFIKHGIHLAISLQSTGKIQTSGNFKNHRLLMMASRCDVQSSTGQ